MAFKRGGKEDNAARMGRKWSLKMKRGTIIGLCAAAVVALAAQAAMAADAPGWDAFVIRNSTSGGIAPAITDTAGGKLFAITLGGQKAGWGTNNMNGKTVGDIQSISITRDNGTAGWGPYMNLWVTDGLGGYAVISNEPSHTSEWAGSSAYDTTWGVLENATSWVYEVKTSQGFKLPNGVTSYVANPSPAGSSPHFTFGDFGAYTIATPPSHWGGTGAPDDLAASTYTAYGVNWVFGDSQSNYLGGYAVSNPTVVPEPATMSLLALGSIATLIRRKRRA